MTETPTSEQPIPTPPPQVPFLQRLEPVPFAVLSLGIVFFLYQFVAGGITALLLWLKVTNDQVLFFRTATIVGQFLFVLLPVVVLVRLRGERVVEHFRIAIPDYKEIILTVVAVFALQQVLQGYLALQSAIPLPDSIQKLIDSVKSLFGGAYEDLMRNLVTAHSPGEFIFVLFAIALTPAICEEFLFRGLVQRSLEKVTIGLQAAMITGAIFAAFHIVPTNFVPLAALGTYFGFIVYRAQNITLSVSAHFFNNFVACTAMYMQLDEDFVAIAPHRTPTPSLIFLNTIVFGVVFIAATYYFIHVTEPAEHSQE